MPFLGLPVSPGGVGVGPGGVSVASGPTLLLGVASVDSVASRRPLGLSLLIEGFLSSAKYLCSWASVNTHQLMTPGSRPGAPMEKTHPRDSYPRTREGDPPDGGGAAQRPHGSKRRPQHEEPFGGERGGNGGIKGCYAAEALVDGEIGSDRYRKYLPWCGLGKLAAEKPRVFSSGRVIPSSAEPEV